MEYSRTEPARELFGMFARSGRGTMLMDSNCNHSSDERVNLRRVDSPVDRRFAVRDHAPLSD